MEAGPGTFDLARIKGYQDVGVQRFSIGVQAFDEASGGSPEDLCVQRRHTEPCCDEAVTPTACIARPLPAVLLGACDALVSGLSWVPLQDLLKACGRSHTLQDVYKAVEAIQQAGVDSWSLDLISGLPNLTPAAWEHSLREAISAQPDHISVYDLQVGVPCHLH